MSHKFLFIGLLFALNQFSHKDELPREKFLARFHKNIITTERFRFYFMRYRSARKLSKMSRPPRPVQRQRSQTQATKYAFVIEAS